MLRPRIPINPVPTDVPTPHVPAAPLVPIHHGPADPAPATSAPAPSAPAHSRVQLTPSNAIALVAGGAAVVLVVGAVLVSMLLAVAITGVSVALVAVVLRLLIKDIQKGR
ncbi:SpdD-like protein [Streptomyces sp. PvR034]|uniref:SpdD-like protein n=1 Tax=Streptomyces sp. PvR034 TaxID=3156401 RepID=UPI003397F1FA